MRLNDLLDQEEESVHVCTQFIAESNGLPLYRNLPIEGMYARRVKVRKRKAEGDLVEVFNAAFQDLTPNLFQRAVFATTTPGEITETTEPFYVFPFNGFKFLYCTEVSKTKTDFQTAIDTLLERFEDQAAAVAVLKELLAMSYVDENLVEGIEKGSEIILYNTPSFLAIRCSAVDSYEEAIALITEP